MPLQKVYDRMISNNLEHLRGFSLDERAARLRHQQLSNQVCLKYYVFMQMMVLLQPWCRKQRKYHKKDNLRP